MAWVIYRGRRAYDRESVEYLVLVRPERRRPSWDVEFTFSSAWKFSEAPRFDDATAAALALAYGGLLVEVAE